MLLRRSRRYSCVTSKETSSLWLVLLVLSALPPLALLGQNNSASRSDVERLEKQFRSKGEPPKGFVEQYVADDYVWMMPGGELGRSDLTKQMEDKTPLDEKIEDLKVRVTGQTAVGYGRFETRTKENQGGKVMDWTGFFLDTWAFQNGTWKLVASSTWARPKMPQ
jgi:ketosteroid isomerase-like protein